jgi:hypothetical protein
MWQVRKMSADGGSCSCWHWEEEGKGGSDNSRASLSNVTGCFLAESHALEGAFRLVQVGDLEKDKYGRVRNVTSFPSNLLIFLSGLFDILSLYH